MSYAVVRGEPTAAQLYLDGILDEVLLDLGVKPDVEQRGRVTLTQLLFYCLKREPNAVFMTNGATGEVVTNGQLLQRAVSLARALLAANASGQHAMLLMRNHQYMTFVYFAVLFSGVIPFCMDPNTTTYELLHFLDLIEPTYVFYDKEHHDILEEALKGTTLKPTNFIVDEPEHLMSFVGGCSDDIDSFQVPIASPDDMVLMLPTSGSTGLPKAAELTHRGNVAQLPTIWATYTRFPTPTDLVMILTSIQWGTFNMMITTCVVYHIPILISPKINTVESVTTLLEKYRPTFAFFAPAFASSLIETIRPDQLTSLEQLILLGAPPTAELLQTLKEKLSEKTHLCDGYGCTEAQGFIALPDREASFKSNGRVMNCLQYKIVDEEGRQLGLNETGELWVKGCCIIKKYHKSDKLQESLTHDGWFMTGDKFHLDEDERVSFAMRIKFSFKFRGCQVAPEEVERVISTVPGVYEAVVCASDNGPAAAVVLLPDAHVSKEDIHQAVNATLSDHKRLHGGILFLSSLPHTNNGKLRRGECAKLILEAIATGDCC